MKKPTIAIDFDGTLCKKQKYGDGEIWQKPNEGAVEALQAFHSEGFKIVIYTVRLHPELKAFVSQKKNIEEWLDLHNIPYWEVTNNKPMALAYIDDRAVRFTNWQDMQNLFVQ